MLYCYCLVPFISVSVLSFTGIASVGATQFSCRINPVVCFLERVGAGGGGGSSKVVGSLEFTRQISLDKIKAV
jgi:hypothetical protein